MISPFQGKGRGKENAEGDDRKIEKEIAGGRGQACLDSGRGSLSSGQWGSRLGLAVLCSFQACAA